MIDDNPKINSPMIMTGALLIAGFLLSSGLVVGQMTPDPAIGAQSIIRSRFMLWDTYEKTIDRNFNIVLISWHNYSDNYTVVINNEYFNGTFYHYTQLNFTYSNISVIKSLTVYINNVSTLTAFDIRLISGISQSQLDIISEPYKISFLPFELTRFEWNLVFSGVVGVIISLPVSYFLVKYYRKRRGAQQI